MTAKQWLRRYINADHRIDSLLRERQDVYDRLTKITAALDSESVSSTKDPHKYDELADLDIFIRQRVSQSMAIRLEITTAIDELEDWRYRDILKYKYINGFTWEQVANAINYSYAQTTRLHGSALKAIEPIINKMMM
jgi:DNA-directed RNA polymerase specialized sigma subunit